MSYVVDNSMDEEMAEEAIEDGMAIDATNGDDITMNATDIWTAATPVSETTDPCGSWSDIRYASMQNIPTDERSILMGTDTSASSTIVSGSAGRVWL